MSGLTPPESRLMAAIEKQAMLDQVEEWANINSGTGNLAGLQTMAGRLGDAFSALPGELSLLDGQEVERVDEHGRLTPVAFGRHLLVRVRPHSRRRVLLTGHMDTVFGPGDGFEHCEWLDDRRLRGPGTADMKGGIAVMLAALKALELAEPELGYDVLINSDEEAGSPASGPIIRELAKGKAAALTYEPALPGGAMARERPGSGNFAAIVTGKPAHAGRNPEEGRNALLAAADLALRLDGTRHSGLAVNPARIDGGGPENIVPALAILRFNMRPRREEDARAAQRLLDEIVAQVAREHGVTIRLHGGFGRPPKPVGQGTRRLFALVVRAGADLGLALDWQDTGGVCDGNNIADCGVPVLDSMGACGGLIHSADEFLLVESLVERARLSALVLHRLATGETP